MDETNKEPIMWSVTDTRFNTIIDVKPTKDLAEKEAISLRELLVGVELVVKKIY